MKQKTLRKAAGLLDDYGRDGDTDVVHVNRREIGLLTAMGGRGTRNPKTGLLEFADASGDANAAAADADAAAAAAAAFGAEADQAGFGAFPMDDRTRDMFSKVDTAVSRGVFGGLATDNDPYGAMASLHDLASLGDMFSGASPTSSFGRAVAKGLASVLSNAPLASSFGATNALSGIGHGFGLAATGPLGALAGLAGTLGDRGISGPSLGPGVPGGPPGTPGGAGPATAPGGGQSSTNPAMVLPPPQLTPPPDPQEMLRRLQTQPNYWQGNQFMMPGYGLLG